MTLLSDLGVPCDETDVVAVGVIHLVVYAVFSVYPQN